MNSAIENSQVLNLIQAMIGAVTPNLRRVTLEVLADEGICLRFLLERDEPEDRDEIGDIVFEFEALQTENLAVDTKIFVDSRPIGEIDLPGRVVFGRKEQGREEEGD